MRMRKFYRKKTCFVVVFAVLLNLLTVTGMEKAKAAGSVTSVKLNKTSLVLEKGKSRMLKATVLPNGARDKTVTWKSSNKKVAKVKNGKVTAKAKGTATITATTKIGRKKAQCKVTVGIKSATKIDLDTNDATIGKGQTVTLKATVTPKKANPKTVTWKSSDPKVATVSKNGVVTGVEVGTVTITAHSWNGKKATCKITVKTSEATPNPNEGTPSPSAKMSISCAGAVNGVLDEKYGMYGTQQSQGIPTLSIPVAITNAPIDAACYAIVMDDPDAGGFVHWLAANITTTDIPENASISKASDMVQGVNDFQKTGYGGPTPPDKTHAYNITVYALKSKVDLKNGFSKSQFMNVIDGKVLEKVTLTAKYVRK